MLRLGCLSSAGVPFAELMAAAWLESGAGIRPAATPATSLERASRDGGVPAPRRDNRAVARRTSPRQRWRAAGGFFVDRAAPAAVEFLFFREVL
jgi:hypothetical protein